MTGKSARREFLLWVLLQKVSSHLYSYFRISIDFPASVQNLSVGCISGMEPHLPTLLPFLFDSLKHEKVRQDFDLTYMPSVY